MTARKRLPPLPKEVMGLQGPIEVVVQAGVVHDDGDECDGLWEPSERRIYVEQDKNRAAMWPILMHEKVHAWCDDIGVQPDPELPPMRMHPDTLEVLCNQIGGALMQEMYRRMQSGKPY